MADYQQFRTTAQNALNIWNNRTQPTPFPAPARTATNPYRPEGGFNTGIVPVDRAQPMANDGGEAARLAAQRVNQMPPMRLDPTQIVPIGQGAAISGPAMEVMQRVQSRFPAMPPQSNPITQFNMDNWQSNLPPNTWQSNLPAGAQAALQAAQGRIAAVQAQADARRQTRAARLAEIMANRGPKNNPPNPNDGQRMGLLGQYGG